MWTLDEALNLIREIQPQLRLQNYHVTLGGGVLNKGNSIKDLDLYFLPLEDDSVHPDDRKIIDPVAVMTIMYKICDSYGEGMEEYEGLRITYTQKLRYMTKDNKQIDVFIV